MTLRDAILEAGEFGRGKVKCRDFAVSLNSGVAFDVGAVIREDWVAVKSNPLPMTFAEAMKHLQDGKRVRRRIYPPGVGFSLENLHGPLQLEYGAVTATDWEVVND